MTPLWIRRLCDAFWREANLDEDYPRTLRPAILRALPLTLVEIPHLRTRTVAEHLRAREVPLLGEAVPDRPLRACLVAHRDTGWLFLDEEDTEDEKRFSLAHELAHFLRHYREPRREAVRRLGESILEVLDGLRPATESERIHGLLREVTIGCHIHLMDREPDGRVNVQIRRAEEEADLLGYHLLAPAEVVFAKWEGVGSSSELVEVLQRTFGFPTRQAKRYAAVLVPPAVEDPLLRALGLSRDFLSKIPRSPGTTREGQQ